MKWELFEVGSRNAEVGKMENGKWLFEVGPVVVRRNGTMPRLKMRNSEKGQNTEYAKLQPNRVKTGWELFVSDY